MVAAPPRLCYPGCGLDSVDTTEPSAKRRSLRLVIDPNAKTAPAGSAAAQPEADATARKPSNRIAMWDRLRIVAWLDVVGFHVLGYHPLLGVGLPTSLLIALALCAHRPNVEPFLPFLRTRMQRLIMPWLLWATVNSVFAILSNVHHGQTLSTALASHPPLSFLHFMWFFPFTVVAGAVVYWLDRLTRGVPLKLFLSVCAAIACVLLVSDLLPLAPPANEAEPPFEQWRFALPAMFLGLVIGRLLAVHPRDRKPQIWGYATLVAIAAAALAASQVSFHGEDPSDPFRYALVCSLLGLGVLLPGTYDRFTKLIEPLLLGGYALHSLVHHQVTDRLMRLMHLPTTRKAGVLATYALTLALVAGLRRTPMRRFL